MFALSCFLSIYEKCILDCVILWCTSMYGYLFLLNSIFLLLKIIVWCRKLKKNIFYITQSTLFLSFSLIIFNDISSEWKWHAILLFPGQSESVFLNHVTDLSSKICCSKPEKLSVFIVSISSINKLNVPIFCLIWRVSRAFFLCRFSIFNVWNACNYDLLTM